MKVKELIAALSAVDPESEVVLQKDSEGNGYSPLEGADPNSVYVPDSSYSGEVYAMDWSASDAAMSEEDWTEMKSRPRCVILFPVN